MIQEGNYYLNRNLEPLFVEINKEVSAASFPLYCYDLNYKKSHSITKDGYQHIGRNSANDIINSKIREYSVDLNSTHMFITDLFNIFYYDNSEDEQFIINIKKKLIISKKFTNNYGLISLRKQNELAIKELKNYSYTLMNKINGLRIALDIA